MNWNYFCQFKSSYPEKNIIQCWLSFNSKWSLKGIDLDRLPLRNAKAPPFHTRLASKDLSPLPLVTGTQICIAPDHGQGFTWHLRMVMYTDIAFTIILTSLVLKQMILDFRKYKWYLKLFLIWISSFFVPWGLPSTQAKTSSEHSDIPVWKIYGYN